LLQTAVSGLRSLPGTPAGDAQQLADEITEGASGVPADGDVLGESDVDLWREKVAARRGKKTVGADREAPDENQD